MATSGSAIRTVGSALAARAARARPGMTLSEIITVMTIAGVVVGIALPRVPVVPMRLDAGARTVFTALQVAQQLAVVRQCNVIVSFDVAGGTVRTLEDRNGDAAVSIGDKVKWQPLQEGVVFAAPPSGRGVNGPVSKEISGSTLSTIEGMPSITFRRNGAASSDIEIYLGLGAIENGSRGVTVSQATGRPSWHRWSGGSWINGGL